MTTNSTEYMREYQRARRQKLKEETKTLQTLQKTVKKSVKVYNPYDSKFDPSNLSILRVFYYLLTKKNDRGPRVLLIDKIIWKLEKLK